MKKAQKSPSLDFTEEPVKSFAGKFVFFDSLFAAERGPDEGVNQGRGVDVGSYGETIRTLHDDKLLAQLFHALCCKRKVDKFFFTCRSNFINIILRRTFPVRILQTASNLFSSPPRFLMDANLWVASC